MDFQYRLTASDYVAAQTAWLMRHPRALGRSLIPLAMLAVLLVVVPIRVALQPARWQELFPALAWTIWPIGSFLIMRWRWSKQFTKSPSSNIDMLATIDERGVTLSALGENKAYYWAGFSQIYESSAVVVFEKGYGDFIYIPKRAIASAQFEELARLTSLAINCKVRLASPLT